MNHYRIKLNLIAILLIFSTGLSKSYAQSSWPSESWASAVNITSVMSTSGLTELSGLFWNDSSNRLFVAHGNGRVRVLQMNTVTKAFTQIGNMAFSGGSEGITQVNLSANEFYTIDEDFYQIRKYTYTSNFSAATLAKSWNILALPSTMTNTGNRGPEGITFVPDSFLIASGFVSQLTGAAYRSVKGMGGLFFVANQTAGYIWVFDVNPNVSNDFAFVGKYQTSKGESCDLAFDKSTGLLYILHNIYGNTLEVTNLATTPTTGGERKFVTKTEFTVSNPTGNVNVEGFAINSKCSDSTNVSVWLCRDVESVESTSYQQDCIRWFNPFNAPGACGNIVPSNITLNLKVFIEGLYSGNGILTSAVNNALQTVCDTVTIELHQTNTTHAIAFSLIGTINLSGNGTFVFPSTAFGNSYYIVVRHRNSLETWSATAINFYAPAISYSFTDNSAKAFGNKLKSVGNGNYAIYSGDVDQNGIINNLDFSAIKSQIKFFPSGYLTNDINGDFLVESSDYSIVENNSTQVITVSRP